MAFEVFCKRFFDSRPVLEFTLRLQDDPAALRGLSGALCLGPLRLRPPPARFSLGFVGRIGRCYRPGAWP